MNKLEDIFEKKKELRDFIKKEKKNYSQNAMLDMSQRIFDKLESLAIFKSAKTILAYSSMNDEVNTHNFLSTWSEIKNIYLPVVKGEGQMDFRKYKKDTQLLKSDYGILEPKGDLLESIDIVDLIIVPGLAFDSSLNRMGRGKAFYDNYLQASKAHKIGVCFDFQIVKLVPHTESDIKMDSIITNEYIFVDS